MALSGSFYTNVGSGWRLQLEWTGTQSISGNYTDVTARLYWMSLGSAYTVSSSATKNCSIYISGTWNSTSAAGMASLSGNQKKLIHTYTKRINHNADGTGSVLLDGYFDLEATLSGTYYGRIDLPSKTYTLDTIPRASTLTSSPNITAGKNLAININRASSSFAHVVKVYVGSSLVKTIESVQTSATVAFTESEVTDMYVYLNTNTTGTTRIVIDTYNGGTYIGTTSYNGTLYAATRSTVNLVYTDKNVYVDEKYGIILNVTGLDTGILMHSVKLKFYNFEKLLTGVDDIVYYAPTATERSEIYSQIPNAKSGTGTIEVTTYYNGVQVGTPNSTFNFTWEVRNLEPLFDSASVSYKDTNSSVSSVTLNDQFIVQNKSNLVVTLAYGATAKEYSSISKYTATVNGESITKTAPFTFPLTFDFGTINAYSNQNLTVTVYDSRDLSTSVTKVVDVVEWSAPVVHTSALRDNGFLDSTVLSLSGSISPVRTTNTSGVTADRNSLVASETKYRTRVTGGSWSSYTAFTGVTLTMPNYTAPNRTLTLSNVSSWEVEVVVTDKFGSKTTTLQVSQGLPIMFIDSNKRSVSIGKFPSLSNGLEVEGDITSYATGSFSDLIANWNISAGHDISASGSITALGESAIYNTLNVDDLKFTTGRTTRYQPQSNCNDLTDEWVLGDGTNYPGSGFFYVNTIFYSKSAGIRKQIAYGYNSSSHGGIHSVWTREYNSSWSEWTPVTPYQYTKGSSVIWKFGNTMIQRKDVTVSVAINNAWGSGYAYDLDMGNWDEPFAENPQTWFSIDSSSGTVLIGRRGYGSPTMTDAGQVTFFRPSQLNSAYTYTAKSYGIGRWK